MEDKITKYRSLLGLGEATKRNIETVEKNIEMLKLRLSEQENQLTILNQKAQEAQKEAQILEKEITKAINEKLEQAKKLEEINDRYETEWWENEEEKAQIIASYKEEEELTRELVELKRWLTIDFGVIEKRRMLTKRV